MPTERQKRLADKLECGMSKTAAMRAEGYAPSTCEHGVTAICESSGVVNTRQKIRADHLAALDQVDCGPVHFAKSVKTGLSRANPGTQRLYAEIVGLLNQEQAQQVFVIVLGAFETVIGKFAPDKRGPALREFAEALQAARDGKVLDLPAAGEPKPA